MKLTPRAGHRQPFSITCTRVNLMGSSKNVNDTAPTNYASNYDIDEELNLIGNDDLLAARAKLDVTRDVEHIAHFLDINKDDLDKKHERPYNRENTASRSICEVKHVLVWIVVRWGTTREVQMLFFYFCFSKPAFGPNPKTHNKHKTRKS